MEKRDKVLDDIFFTFMVHLPLAGQHTHKLACAHTNTYPHTWNYKDMLVKVWAKFLHN